MHPNPEPKILLRKPVREMERDAGLKRGLERAGGVGREPKTLRREPEPEDPASRKKTARG